ncbi:MAG: L-serine ammonia-lyase, iron-sulfur-dependent subunit beta [Clostridia bacterium]|nr:L-serine ammonia-lyase, iron-sulfur-dependent subunit beta [Clostridia bacterium]
MGVFDIIGPVMIGPSSSHTAGAARIGRVARGLLGEEIRACEITLTGSFAATASGHGTDRAIVAGILGMEIDDPDLRRSFAIAKERGLKYEFRTRQIQGAHPNTVIIEARGDTRNVNMRASSIGGGSISVDELDGLPVSFSGRAHTLIISHRDRPGVIAAVSGAIARVGINIATMQVFRVKLAGDAIMAIEMDEYPDNAIVGIIEKLDGVERVSLLKSI